MYLQEVVTAPHQMPESVERLFFLLQGLKLPGSSITEAVNHDLGEGVFELHKHTYT
jgi:hypothetical protein